MADRPVSPPPSHEAELIWGYILAGFGAVLFSAKAILIKLAYGVSGPIDAPGVDAITMLALRMAFALPVYVAIGVWSWRRRAHDARPRPTTGQILLIGLIGMLGYYVASYSDFLGLTYITAQFERLILFTYPMFVMVLGALFFGGRITGKGVASLAIAYLGITVIYFRGDIATGPGVLFGAGLVLTAAFTFALYQLLAKNWITRIGSRIFTCIAMSGAGLAALIHFVIRTEWSGSLAALDIPDQVIWIAAALALFSTILPSFMLNAALGRIGPQAVSMIGTVSPISTIVMAIVLLGEPFSFNDAAGTALVLLGVGLYTVKRR